MRHSPRLSAAVVGLMWLVAAARPSLAEPKSMSGAELRADVARLQTLVMGCEAAGAPATACDPAAVGDDLRVEDAGHGGYAVHWSWLRDALRKSEAADAGKRADLLKEAEVALGRIAAELDGASGGVENFEQARREADAVLARPEFQRDTQPTWWDRLKARFFGWLMKALAGVGRVGEAAPWIGPVLEWLLFLGAAVGLLFFVMRNLARQRLRVALGNATLQTSAWDREAIDWAKQAEEFANAGDWREAVHCLYWAAIVSLEARRAWRHNPTRTPREYLRLLKPGSAQQRGLRGLTRIFERVWYGLREGRAAEYAEARAMYEALAVGSLERSGDAPSLPDALGQGGAA